MDAGLTMRSAQAWAWTERDPDGRATQRLLLRGDVTMSLGAYEFVASRASVWIEQLETADGPVWQVALYFDRVSDPRAGAGLRQSADRLLVTAVIDQRPRLLPDRLERTSVGRTTFVVESERRLARWLAEVAGVTPTAPRGALSGGGGRAPVQPGINRPFSPDSPLGDVIAELDTVPSDGAPELIFPRRGVFTIAFGEGTDLLLQRGEDADVLAIPRGVTVQYSSPMGDDGVAGRDPLMLTAQRGVIFFEPGSVTDALSGGGAVSSDSVIGIYLEGAVSATDGQYTLRGPRMYFDPRRDKALVLDAVFSTYDRRLGSPLYVRAAAIRQEARQQFTARRARVATSAFFEPHFSVGVTSMTLTQRSDPGSRRERIVDAEDITLRGGGFPLFYFPRFVGDIDNFPLRRLGFSGSAGGPAITTGWNLFGLIGVDPPESLDIELLIDGYFERGVALGADVAWDKRAAEQRWRGNLLVYSMIRDQGSDRLTTGADIGRDNETRTLVMGEHKWSLGENWEAQLDLSYISDPAFVDSFFEPLAESRREFENAAYVKWANDASALTFEVKGTLNDFTPNEYLLQSRGYVTEKLPEVVYRRYADDVLGLFRPGLLYHSSESRVGLTSLRFVDPNAEEFGLVNSRRSDIAFGVNPDESLADRLTAEGFVEDRVFRADTRHELSTAFDAGPVRFRPFVVGRLTYYSDDFEEFSPDADESLRTFGAVGVTASTSIVRVNNSVDSRFFDLRRVRHIIEPSVTAWYAGSSLDETDLPVYDETVESVADGGAVRLALEQTWQTKRGGPGRWTSVDFFTLDAEFVWANDDADDGASPIGRYSALRPELSKFSNFSSVNSWWRVTDAAALTSTVVYDFDTDQIALFGAGGSVRLSGDLQAFAEGRFIEATESTLVNFGAGARITKKYRVRAWFTVDAEEEDIQKVTAVVRRSFPDLEAGVVLAYDNIREEFSFGVELTPRVAPGPGLRLRGIGGDRDDRDGSGIGR